MKKADVSVGEAATPTETLDCAISRACVAVSHNLNGQRLGRKGRFTRERIIRVALDLLENDEGDTFTLSAVARKAALRMSSLYNYFNDINELMIAVLEPVMASAESSYLEAIRDYWPDEELPERCAEFWSAYRDFWLRHAALLHQRNRMSDAGDERMMRHRLEAVLPLLHSIHFQLGIADGSKPDSELLGMGAVLMTGIERSMTVQTLPNFNRFPAGFGVEQVDLVRPGARLLELVIRDSRKRLRNQHK